MEGIAKFKKISFEQFKKDWINCFPQSSSDNIDIKEIYDNIKLPRRGTIMSAGYDFFAPNTFKINIGNTIKIPTGICCKINPNWVLSLYPRSGQGFKYGIYLANTVGIVDADYINADNEGHIFVKLVNDSTLAQDFTIKQGQAFCQGIFIQYGLTIDDSANGERTGGFGSTDRN